MSDTLLVVLGDSWSYGLGAQEPEIFETFPNIDESFYDDRSHALADSIIKNKSWPALLAKKNKWDLKNLSIPGAANNALHHALLKYLSFNMSDLQKYKEVKVVCLATHVERYSLISPDSENMKHLLLHCHPSRTLIVFGDKKRIRSTVAVFRKYHNLKEDAISHLISIQELCKAYGLTYYWGGTFTEPSMYKHTPISPMLAFDRCINTDHDDTLLSLLDSNTIATCGHPNEHGYQIIMEYLDKNILRIDAGG